MILRLTRRCFGASKIAKHLGWGVMRPRFYQIWRFAIWVPAGRILTDLRSYLGASTKSRVSYHSFTTTMTKINLPPHFRWMLVWTSWHIQSTKQRVQSLLPTSKSMTLSLGTSAFLTTRVSMIHRRLTRCCFEPPKIAKPLCWCPHIENPLQTMGYYATTFPLGLQVCSQGTHCILTELRSYLGASTTLMTYGRKIIKSNLKTKKTLFQQSYKHEDYLRLGHWFRIVWGQS